MDSNQLTLLGKNFKNKLNNCIYVVIMYIVEKDWYKTRYKELLTGKYYYSYLTRNELLDKMYFEEVITFDIETGSLNPQNSGKQLDKGERIVDRELQQIAFDDLTNDHQSPKEIIKCQCGIDVTGGGKHSDYCDKYQGDI